MGPDYPFLFEAFEFTAARREMPFRRSGTRITTAAGVFLNLFLKRKWHAAGGLRRVVTAFRLTDLKLVVQAHANRVEVKLRA
ncbi:hypothetical protein GCM10023174_22090 [Chelativorans composti]